MADDSSPKGTAEERKAQKAREVEEHLVKLRFAEARVDYAKAVQEHKYFTRRWNEELEAVMSDRLSSNVQRITAWAQRWSWGEYSLFAIGRDGHPRYQVDCRAELGLTKQAVSNTVSYLQKRGYWEDLPKLIRPVIAPVLGPLPVLADPEEYKAFVESWKVVHSADFERMEVARDVYWSIKKVLLSEYKKSKRDRTRAAASLLETLESNSETSKPAVLSPFQEDQNRIAASSPPAEKPGRAGMQSKAQAAQAYLFAEIARMQQAYPDSGFAKPPIDPQDPGDQGLVKRIVTELGSYDEEYLVGFVTWCSFKFKGIGLGGKKARARTPGTESGPVSIGLLVNWAQDYARIAKPTAAEERRAQSDPRVEREMRMADREEAEWQELGETEQRKRIQPHVKELKADPSVRRQLSDKEIYEQATILARRDLRAELESESSAGA